MKNYIIILVCLSFLFSENFLEQGIIEYNNRSIGSNGLSASSIYINKAIDLFEKDLASNDKDNQQTVIFLLKAYYYKGEYAIKDTELKKEIFDIGKALAEKYITIYPNSAAIRYWYLVNLGSWAQVYGTIAAAREGVADLMKKHSEIIIELDEKYMDGGGYFMLGAVHLKSPYIPFILSWPSNKLAVKYLNKAMSQGDKTSLQTVYFARALFKEGRKKEAKDLLTNLISKPLSLENKVEDLKNKLEAEDLIAKWN